MQNQARKTQAPTHLYQQQNHEGQKNTTMPQPTALTKKLNFSIAKSKTLIANYYEYTYNVQTKSIINFQVTKHNQTVNAFVTVLGSIFKTQ
jgi:hypothetical protein